MNEIDKKFVKQNIWNIVNIVTMLVTFLREFNFKKLLFVGNQQPQNAMQSGENGQQGSQYKDDEQVDEETKGK